MKLDNSKRTRCERWTRVMGYHRPVTAFNKGKQSEFKERVYYKQPML
jgi:anaerobic ribonucleoside-triphosphate reductase